MIDAFKIGVHIGMTTNSPQVLALMLRQLTGIHMAAGHVNSQFSTMAKLAVAAGQVFAGGAIIKGLIDATKHAEQLNHELVKLQTGARLSDAQTTNASNLAFKISRDVRGSSVADNVKVQRELFGVFGNMDVAQQLAPQVIQGSRATSNFVDKDTDLAQIAVRALELRGHITKDHKVDPKEFATEFNNMVRAIVASEGLIDPQKLFMFIRQAGPAARGMSSEAMWGEMPAIMNALGSGPGGTAFMSLFQQMIGHVVAGKRVAVAMEQAGMLTPGKWRTERGGKVVMDHDAVPDQAGFMADPVSWLHTKLEEMRKQKGKDGKPVDTIDIIQRIFQIPSRSTSARLISDIDANYPIIENEKARFNRMPGPEAINKEQNDKDLSVNLHNLSEAWNNFMAALGGPGVPIAIGVLHSLTDALNFLQSEIIKHPTAAKDLFYLASGIGGFLVLGGTAAIITAVASALAPFAAAGAAGLALTALGAGLGGLAAVLGGGAIQDLLKWLGMIPDTSGPHATGGGRGRMPGSPGTGGPAFHGDGIPGAPGAPSSAAPALPAPQQHPAIGGGRGSVHSSYLPPPTTTPRVQTVVYLQLDGRTIGKAVSEAQARAWGLPNSGATRFDGRQSPSYPSDTIKA